MAERGVDDDNPFSFKKFVTTKDKPTASGVKLGDDTDDEDIFSVSDVKLDPAKADKSSDDSTSAITKTAGTVTVGGSQKGNPKKGKQKENPFSFKKFLSSGTGNSKKGISSSLNSSESTDTESAYSLPDNIQVNGRIKNHIIGLPGNGTDKMILSDSFHIENTGKEPIAPLDLPLFLDAKVEITSDFDHFNFHERGEVDEIDDPLSLKDGASSGPLALPDFLSDTALLNGRQTATGAGDDKTGENYEELLDKIRLLQEENDTLRSDLHRERLKSHEKNLRLTQLKVDLERQKKKEAEDMAVLERAVQQVEENLVTTTKRAVQAEATVTKLKQEVRSLQKQLKTLSAESEAFRSGDKGLSDIRERTKYTSDELKAAAVIAEKNIKELMAGVDRLKLLSQVLSSLEKVTDVIPEVLQEDDTKPS